MHYMRYAIPPVSNLWTPNTRPCEAANVKSKTPDPKVFGTNCACDRSVIKPSPSVQECDNTGGWGGIPPMNPRTGIYYLECSLRVG